MKVIEKLHQDRAQKEAKREEREEESIRLLKEITENQEEVILTLQKNFNSANQTLDMILNSLGLNSQKTQEAIKQNGALIQELKDILEEEKRDPNSGKLSQFVSRHGIEAFSVILQLLSMILQG